MLSQNAHNELLLLDDAPGRDVPPAIRAELIESGFAEMTYETLTITEAGRMFVRRPVPPRDYPPIDPIVDAAPPADVQEPAADVDGRDTPAG